MLLASSSTNQNGRIACPAARRQRGEQSVAAADKAEREKERRNRLHAKFMELSQLLDPGRPPKTDKSTILTDAVRVIGQLRNEAEQLKESNVQLRSSIKELKVGAAWLLGVKCLMPRCSA